MPLAVLRVGNVLAKAAREKNVRRHWVVFPPHFFDGRIHFAQGEDGRAKLADLGVAKPLADAAELTSLDQGVGTPYYMPWEQMLNASLVDARSDLFALGATFITW